jgi:hypothetical protein
LSWHAQAELHLFITCQKAPGSFLFAVQLPSPEACSIKLLRPLTSCHVKTTHHLISFCQRRYF